MEIEVREIEFRAKDIDEEKGWRYGNLDRDITQKRYYISTQDEGIGRTVIEETIGQYTGLKDKNGIKIFEGDIVSIEDRRIIGKVVFDIGYLGYFIYISEEFCIDEFENGIQPLYEYENNIEVIGNIYDNPELLKGE